MRIKIFPPPGCDRSPLDEKGWMEVPDGASIADVLKLIHCSKLKAKILLISLNGERVSLSTELHDGDIVGFFMPAVGG